MNVLICHGMTNAEFFKAKTPIPADGDWMSFPSQLCLLTYKRARLIWSSSYRTEALSTCTTSFKQVSVSYQISQHFFPWHVTVRFSKRLHLLSMGNNVITHTHYWHRHNSPATPPNKSVKYIYLIKIWNTGYMKMPQRLYNTFQSSSVLKSYLNDIISSYNVQRRLTNSSLLTFHLAILYCFFGKKIFITKIMMMLSDRVVWVLPNMLQ